MCINDPVAPLCWAVVLWAFPLLLPLAGNLRADAQSENLQTSTDQGVQNRSEDRPSVVTGSGHWAYQPFVRPALPRVIDQDWSLNAIDDFVLARLKREDLRPSSPADRPILLRRVTLDLIGLPPSIEELDTFLADPSPDAYEKVVDRLLRSPHYGEHWARPWLDLARYADSNGYNIDVPRSMWPYRDWVIQAINDNMPFDQFTIEQVAGDLLPDATRDQRIATGFHRNTMINEEGGVDTEENRVASVVDRVNTTATVWLGTTLECAQCHSHKHDPFTQQEYFQFYAFFNNSSDDGGAGPNSSREPIVYLMKPAEQQELERIRAEIAHLEIKQQESTPGAKAEPTDQVKEMLEEVRKEEADLLASVPSTLVMQDRAEPRTTRIHLRGDFLDLGAEVTPAVPAVLHAWPHDQPANRLGLAHWLVDPNNPLLARVTVNRMWQGFFGLGIVATSHDFGTQGNRPSHPELLDWLATELVATGWNTKAMHKQIVMSATYQQSSRVGQELLGRDPHNRLLARGPRLRMEAEMIRDNALAISGLLNLEVGGPSVYPPQPPGFWLEFGTKGFGMEKWPASTGANRYRRGLYTFWRRTTTYPSFTTFDAPSRDRCIVWRPRTNTPLQALTTLNDPVFVEASVALARRIMRLGGTDLAERTTYGFRLCQGRRPQPEELRKLDALYHQQLVGFLKNPESARALVANGSGQSLAAANVCEIAAWTVVASVLLNLDATITKS